LSGFFEFSSSSLRVGVLRKPPMIPEVKPTVPASEKGLVREKMVGSKGSPVRAASSSSLASMLL
jgi:hypothetical protein